MVAEPDDNTSTSGREAAEEGAGDAPPPAPSSLPTELVAWVRGTYDRAVRRFHDYQRHFAEQVGGRLDVLADMMTLDCDTDVADATQLEDVSIPRHHFAALAALRERDPAEYQRLLGEGRWLMQQFASNSMDYRPRLARACAPRAPTAPEEREAAAAAAAAAPATAAAAGDGGDRA